MNFASDNTTGAPAAILQAITRAAEGRAMPYGDDDWTRRVESRLREIFEIDCAVFVVATGTAANCLGLAAMSPPWGAVYCHHLAHVNVDECGAPELFTGGAKLVPLPGEHGKLAPAQLEGVLAAAGKGVAHHVQPAALSLTQATECGTVYTQQEVANLAEVARRWEIGVQMDGARFANALLHLGCTPAEITWKAGVDALAFGATKNGCIGAEALVLFRRELAASIPYRRKRGGHLLSKMRFLSAQLDAYLRDDLWLELARHANAMAARLNRALARVTGVHRLYPVEANEVFVALAPAVVARLRGDGFVFYDWPAGGPHAIRLVCGFDTSAAEIDAFAAAVARAVDASVGGEPDATRGGDTTRGSPPRGWEP